MGRSLMVFVTQDALAAEKCKEFAHGLGVEVQVYDPQVWSANLGDSQFRESLGAAPTMLVAGEGNGAKVLPFPGGASQPVAQQFADGVTTINELEAKAIERAIQNFRGNLTEAAKALGIGRATLYRKVKLYNLDPSQARRMKRAA